jgi:hypothetical protein
MQTTPLELSPLLEFIGHLVYPVVNVVFVCLAFAKQLNSGINTRANPGDWGYANLQYILAVFEFSMVMLFILLLLVPGVKYFRHKVTVYQLANEIRVSWGNLNFSSMNGLKLISTASVKDAYRLVRNHPAFKVCAPQLLKAKRKGEGQEGSGKKRSSESEGIE